MAKKTSQVRFLDGVVFSKRTIVIAARPVALDDDEEGTRVFTCVDGNWSRIDLEIDVWAVCMTRKPAPTIYMMGRDGRLSLNVNGQLREELIEDAGHEPNQLGYLFEMQEIDGTLFACGDSGQVYRREQKGWVHFDQGVLDRGDPLEVAALFSIDGVSQKDIYAVGQGGSVWHYNGNSWKKELSPTTMDLNAVRCVANNEAYLCGDGGVFFKRSGGDWRLVPVPAGVGNLSAVEYFEGKVFLASETGLLEYDGKTVQKAQIDLNPVPDAHRLHANDGLLWSFGVHHLCFFDGKKWTYVKHPDNA